MALPPPPRKLYSPSGTKTDSPKFATLLAYLPVEYLNERQEKEDGGVSQAIEQAITQARAEYGSMTPDAVKHLIASWPEAASQRHIQTGIYDVGSRAIISKQLGIKYYPKYGVQYNFSDFNTGLHASVVSSVLYNLLSERLNFLVAREQNEKKFLESGGYVTAEIQTVTGLLAEYKMTSAKNLIEIVTGAPAVQRGDESEKEEAEDELRDEITRLEANLAKRQVALDNFKKVVPYLIVVIEKWRNNEEVDPATKKILAENKNFILNQTRRDIVALIGHDFSNADLIHMIGIGPEHVGKHYHAVCPDRSVFE